MHPHSFGISVPVKVEGILEQQNTCKYVKNRYEMYTKIAIMKNENKINLLGTLCIITLFGVFLFWLSTRPTDEEKTITDPQQVREWAQKFHETSQRMVAYVNTETDYAGLAVQFVDLYAVTPTNRQLVLSYGIGYNVPWRALEPYSVTLWPGRIPLRGEALDFMRHLARPHVEAALDSISLAVQL